MTAEDRAEITGLLLAYDAGEREAFDVQVSVDEQAERLVETARALGISERTAHPFGFMAGFGPDFRIYK